ncbi:response regulator transcription factor [Alkaliphilus hydrothermalis]|uniref:Stage 0 sporulation protein A homolog n=1 Tax=Alkaliphilus hydrothermalis TaxID=1482730 RepID=A0ABS2NPE2_9FIRM|nr:response regulator transcription factor [Alkaliphilus hydrothermalis]MBM7614687.1 DNA-binding NarL/FixJ family response regulator [Alkaliphilus hydrothermalis]
MEKIKILVVEDDLAWIKLLEMLFKIEGDMEIVAAVKEKKEFYEIIENGNIDVILMDINLTSNQLDGIYIAAEVSGVIDAKIIMLTSLEPKEVALDSFNAGAVEFLSKSHYKKLPQVIRDVMNRNTPMEDLLKDYRRLKEQEMLSCLSGAEKEVFSLVEQGYTRDEIREKLVKSDSTIKNQINKIISKLGVGNVKEAIIKIKCRGLYNSKEL